MSLKAKLEAVIYAAEEPVTLAQLAALFTADALEWKAQQEAVSAERAAEDAEPLPPMAEAFAYPDPVLASAVPLAPEPASAAETQDAEVAPDSNPEQEPEAASSEAAPDADADAALDAEAELELKRQARQRDREARAILRQLLDELITAYASDERGVEIREIAGGYRIATKPECHDAVRLFVKSLKPALRLSLPALETLAVVAYKQPVTAPEVNEIRGVDSSGVFGSLLARKLITTAGRKQVIGRPILYKTTREFLLRFGLKDVAELPSMEEFEKMAAIELDEPEPESDGEAAPAPASSLDARLEFDGESAEQEAPADQHETQLPAPVPAVMAAQESTETPAATAADPSETTEPEIQAESIPAEAAPAAPSPTEQAETETFSHDQEDQKVR
jgi:segregation and condensation protein B